MTAKTTTNCNVIIQDIKSCSVGFLQSSQIFYSQHQLGCSIDNNVIINYHTVEIDQYPNRIIKVIGNVANSTTIVTIEIDRSTLGSCVFLSAADHGTRSFSLYLHITSTPLMNLHNNETCRLCVNPTGGKKEPQEQQDLLALSSFPVLQLNFSLESWEKIFEVVCNPENFSLPCLATRIVAADKSEESCSHFPDIVLEPHLAWDLYWSYSVLSCSLKHSIAANPRVIGLLHHEFNSVMSDRSDTNSRNLMVYVFQQLALRLQSINPWSNLEDILPKCQAIAASSQGSSIVHRPTQYSCYRVVVTPSSVIFLSPIPIQSSRLIREFGSTHRLVYVHFRNENLDLTYNANFANSRVLSILSNGLHVNGWMKLHFLCCSNSQIRQSNSIFIQASSEVVQELKHSLIPLLLESFKGDFAKKISRFGLFATSDCDVGTLSSKSIKVIGDDYTPGSVILTDGAGLIPRSLLVEIIKSNDDDNFEPEEESMKFLRTSNAIQIRHMGHKGVLTIIDEVDVLNPRLKVSFSPCHALMRKSMEKFASPHDKLGVVKVSYNMPLKLNRDMLNLLFSFSGEGQDGGDFNPLSYIFRLQEIQLQKYADGLVCSNVAETMLRDFIDDKILLDAKQSSIALTDEPYFRGLLTTIYQHKTVSLRRKTHIPISQGSMLMGIPDFTDSLKDGQVFVQIQDNGEETINITGNVLVYRNPCLDPADLRILDAVAVHLVPKLKNIKNVIVFPAALSSTVSVSAQCSGGDLDGDLFSVIWDKNLIPPKAREYSPLNYDDIVKEGKRKQQSVPPKSEPEFLVKCMSCPLLGKVAKSHLAISDHLPNGSADPLARELASVQALAVDFPKTGIMPPIPREVKELLRKNGYPDFMEMPNRMAYPSKKPLGKLYQRCVSIIYDGDIRDISVELDPLLVHPDSSMFEQMAIDICNEYINSILEIQHRYSLTSENELILGLAPLGKSQEFIGLKRDMIENFMKRDWNDIVQYFRKKVINLLPPSADDDRYKLVSALYQAAYSCRENNEGLKCLGLPWIFSDFLMEYRRLRMKEASVAYDSKGGSTSLLKEIGEKVLKQWNETVPLLRSSQLERLKFFHSFVDTLQKVASKSIPPIDDIVVKLYGSCSHFLCDAASDMDVFVEASPSTIHKSLQTNQLYDMLSDFCTTVQPKGSVLRCTCELNSNDTGSEEIHLDVGTCTDGLEKVVSSS